MKKILSFIFVFLSIMLIIPVYCIADGFELVSSNVVDGDKNIPKDIIIELVFSSNMTDISVLSYNKDCFSLFDSENNSIPIKLVLPDTQVQQTFKKQAFIYPLKELQPGENYRILISQKLMDKNGNQLGRDYIISFNVSTDESLTTPPNETLSKLGEDTTIFLVDNDNSESLTDNTKQPDTTKKEPVNSNQTSYIMPISIFLIAIIIVSFTLLILKSKNFQN